MFLSEGEIVYYGPTRRVLEYFKAIDQPIPPATNPADHIRTHLTCCLSVVICAVCGVWCVCVCVSPRFPHSATVEVVNLKVRKGNLGQLLTAYSTTSKKLDLARNEPLQESKGQIMDYKACVSRRRYCFVCVASVAVCVC